MKTTHDMEQVRAVIALLDEGAGRGVVSRGIPITISQIDAPCQGGFFFLTRSETYPSSVFVLDLGLSNRSDETLDAILPISEDGTASTLGVVPASPDGEPLTSGPSLGTWNAQAEHTDLGAVFALLLQALPGGDDRHIVGQLARTLPMGPSYHPTATDGGSYSMEVTADRDGLETVTAETLLPSTEEPVPTFGDGTRREPTSENTAPNGMGHGDECEAMRALMPRHLLRDLDGDLDQALIDHVRSCPECHSVLMALRIEIEVAAEKAEHEQRRMPR